MRIALFPGTFDPITLGHVDVIRRAIPLFDKIVIGVGLNSSKQPMFTIEQRLGWIDEIFRDTDKVEAQSYEGLTIDYCEKISARFILRGIRYVSDFEYEKGIADMNRMLSKHIETIFLTSSPQYSTVSSTLVRDVIRYNGDVRQFLPEEVQWK
ncbi:MAG: pantetheine-phosphate adenylyltransferase [Bacteroidetes bacterium 43-16]|nr:MAG: pantetheine-phosphate adenylyltransferase [Bacteroidetes bacterium 43-16]